MKPCIEDNIKGIFIPSNLRNKTSSKRLKIYKRILANARLSNEHIDRIRNPCESDEFLCGRATQEIFGSMISDRSFDTYGRHIKINGQTEEILSKPRDTKQSKTLREKATNLTVEETEKILTQSWKIGYKPVKFGPPGVGPPIKNVLNSDGHEKFFCYEGSWKDGNMEGEGKYVFEDGSIFKGSFKSNFQHGKGQATYHCGTIYIGEWQNGYPHGKGRVVYKNGLIYEGTWKSGRRHGKGLLSYPNGSYYEGGFSKGKFHGKGKFVSKGNCLTYSGGFKRGYVARIGTVTFPNGRKCRKEWPNEYLFKCSIHQVIAQVKNEWENRVTLEKRLNTNYHEDIKVYKLKERVKKIQDQIKDRRQKEKDEKKLKKRS